MSAHENVNRAQFSDAQLRTEHHRLGLRLAGMPLGMAGAVAAVAAVPPPLSIPLAVGAMVAGKKIYGSDSLHEDHEREWEHRGLGKR